MAGGIAWKNYVAEDTDGAAAASHVSGSFSALALDANYPGANVIDGDPSLVSRVNFTNGGGGSSTAALAVDWGTNQSTRIVAALNVRLPASGWGSVRFVVTSSSGTDLETTTGVEPGDLVPIPGETDRFNLYALLSADRLAARLRLELVDVEPGEAGYFEAGHLYAGPALVFSGFAGAFDRDWRVGVIDDSKVSRFGGSYAAYRYPRRKVLESKKSLLSYASAIGTDGVAAAANLRHIAGEVGASSPVVVILRDSDAHALQTLSCYGLLADPLAVGHIGANRFSTELRVEEIR